MKKTVALPEKIVKSIESFISCIYNINKIICDQKCFDTNRDYDEHVIYMLRNIQEVKNTCKNMRMFRFTCDNIYPGAMEIVNNLTGFVVPFFESCLNKLRPIYNYIKERCKKIEKSLDFVYGFEPNALNEYGIYLSKDILACLAPSDSYKYFKITSENVMPSIDAVMNKISNNNTAIDYMKSHRIIYDINSKTGVACPTTPDDKKVMRCLFKKGLEMIDDLGAFPGHIKRLRNYIYEWNKFKEEFVCILSSGLGRFQDYVSEFKNFYNISVINRSILSSSIQEYGFKS